MTRDDERYVSSACCTWHGSINEVGAMAPLREVWVGGRKHEEIGHRLPCCPHCGSPLMQHDSRLDWDAAAEKFIAAQLEGFDADLYRRWLQSLHDSGTCVPLKGWDWSSAMKEFGERK